MHDNHSLLNLHAQNAFFTVEKPQMAHAFIKILLLITIFSITSLHTSDGQLEDWCVADEQTPDDELQRALIWACENGADCSKIEANQPCFEPNTIKDHASFAFNSYFQRMKAKGATCYFNAAAFVTDLDPSHGSCKFEIQG